MNDIIDLIRSKALTVATPLALPELDDIVVAQEELLISLPPDFREFLLCVSDVVFGSLAPVTLADPQSHTHLPELAAQAWDLGMPRDLLPLCQSEETFYCVAQDGEVYCWQEGQDEANPAYEDVWQWAEQVWLQS